MRPVLLTIAIVLSSAAPSAASTWLVPPVDGAIERRFEQPGSQWGPGHRGIDYGVGLGTAVRAVASGTVVFAGDVAGTRAVTVAHPGGLESTYSDLSEVLVMAGDRVEQGYWIGRSGKTHDGGSDGMHLGIKLEGAYVDPEAFIGPQDMGSAIRLVPLVWEPPDTLPAAFRAPFLTAETGPVCQEIADGAAGPPNDNIAVMIAGIGSKTAGGTSAALYEAGEELLGYAEPSIYRFSYRGHEGDALHEPYPRADTFGDIRSAADKLRDLLRSIAERHPGRDIDLIAHSQGGIVARSYLQLAATAWDPKVPRVDHLVTFSTPHDGAPLAGGRSELELTNIGRALLDTASWWANNGGPIPDPYSRAVTQLAPGSDLLERLDRESVLWGTRVLSLALPNDVVVPADHAVWDEYQSSVVGPEGLNGHDAVVTSAAADAIARRFLRDGPSACRGSWDLWGPRVGRVVSFAERALPWLYRKTAGAVSP